MKKYIFPELKVTDIRVNAYALDETISAGSLDIPGSDEILEGDE